MATIVENVVPSAPPTSQRLTTQMEADDDKKELGTASKPPEHPGIDVHNVSLKIQRAKDAYEEFAGIDEEAPSNGEMYSWYIYGLCSYFIHTIVIPILFPLLITQVVYHIPTPPSPTPRGWNQVHLYEGLTKPSISLMGSKFSPLEWTAISWATGLLLSSPVLIYITPHLDHGRHQNLIFAGATVLGSLVCLPAGFLRVTWIFPLYIVGIVIANTVTTASHTRHLGVMVRGFFTTSASSSIHQKRQFHDRKNIIASLSLYATAAGCLGAAVISAFIYQMLRHSEKFLSLWIVAIFSGLKWAIGTLHAISVKRPATEAAGRMLSEVSKWKTSKNLLSMLTKHPHATGSLFAVLISSFTSTCIFMGGIQFVVGELSLKPVFILFLLLTYFIVPLFVLPLLHPLQLLIKTDAVRMQFLGFFMCAITSGIGYYYRHKKNDWNQLHISLMVGVQSIAAGILHAFGRVLLLDCTPPRKEGAFSAWFAWIRGLGTCGGFVVATSVFSAEKVIMSFSVTFCTALAGMLVLILGNISNYSGAIAAGHVVLDDEASEKGSPVHG